MNKVKDIKISSLALSIDDCYRFVIDEKCGGNCLFVGTVRNHNRGENITHLLFDAYKEMAISEMHKIADMCFEEYDVKKIAIHHREGQVEIKEIAVIIAISSAHRDAAFKACRFMIDRLKETVPIWKKEFLEDSSYWINAHP